MLEFLKRTLKVEGEEESLPKEDEDATKAEDGKTRENKFKKQEHLRTEYNRRKKKIRHIAFSSAPSLSRVRLCDPMDCGTSGLPVHL